jgi:tetratricopeptide (TPR) repeat protein
MSNPVQSLDTIAPMQDAKKEGKPKDPVQADYEEGKRFFAEGNIGQAAVAFHNALLGYEEKKDTNGIANAANQIGKICLERGEYEKALKSFNRAWDICEEIGDPASLLTLNKEYAKVYRGLKDYKSAIGVCLDIIDTYQGNNNPKGTVETLETIAEIYLEMDDKVKAADTYRTISSIHANYKHESIAKNFAHKAAELEG